MSHERVYQRLREHLAYLKLTSAAEVLATKLDAAHSVPPGSTFAPRLVPGGGMRTFRRGAERTWSLEEGRGTGWRQSPAAERLRHVGVVQT